MFQEFAEGEILAAKAQDEELRVEAKVWRGNLYYHSGRFHEALKIFRDLLPIYEQMGKEPGGVRSYTLSFAYFGSSFVNC